MGVNAIRLTIADTHPVQYLAPWYRHIAANCPEIDLTVVYASRPHAVQQGAGFDTPFEWDAPLLDGYRSTIVRESRPEDRFASGTFRGLDVDGFGRAIVESRPDAILVAGWHSITLVRAILTGRLRRVPVIYRGDTNLLLKPRSAWRAGWRLKTRAMLRLFRAHLAVGRRSREYLLANGVRPTAIFASPHAVDNDAFARAAAPHLTSAGRCAARAAIGAGGDDFVVLFVGKLTERKRPHDLLRAVARLGAGALLVVAGGGELERPLREEAARLGIRVAWLGFVNQRALGRVYAAADCLALPSDGESWGLVVNEGMATGLPAVVSDRVGCAPDLLGSADTGAVFPAGDLDALVAALADVRARGGRDSMAAACREQVARHDFAAAATGLVAACESVSAQPRSPTRVIACCGGMVIVGGLERMTFEVLGVVRERGGAVHCIVNSWENHRIVPLADRLGATWSTGFYWYPFSTRPRSIVRIAQLLWDAIRTSAGLLRDAMAFRPTHILVPEYAAVLRNAPALALMKLFGVEVVFRIGNAPDRGRIHDVLWGRMLPPFVTRFVPNSKFGYGRLQQTGVPAAKITLIRNALSRRAVSAQTDADVVRLAASRPTILTVGQLAPFKGTHLTVEATLALLAERFDVQAIIVGPLPVWPPERTAYVADLQARIDAAGAGERVHLVGGRENVLAIMEASYVLAVPILQEETFGNVVLEARSVGLPVVTFARGGLPELVEHGRTGYVCAGTEVRDLVDGLRFYLANPVQRATASANCVADSSRPEDECGRGEFARRWWSVFEHAS